VILKVLLMGSLAQVGLALATAIGAWINLLLVLGFAVRAGYLELTRPLLQSLLKFLGVGVVLAGVLWVTANFAAVHFSGPLRDEIALLLLIAVGAVVYGGAITGLFGLRWLRSLVRG
jgi:putative peptidoglycan lipid II flippase